jgi:hypothetical protein
MGRLLQRTTPTRSDSSSVGGLDARPRGFKLPDLHGPPGRHVSLAAACPASLDWRPAVRLRKELAANGGARGSHRPPGFFIPPASPYKVRMPLRPFLVAGPYRPPRLKIGDRTTCLYRDRNVIVTGLSSAPIQWPRCCAVDVGGHPGLLVEEVLLRAIRPESAMALRYWFGVSGWVVWTWRKAFGVGRFAPRAACGYIRIAPAPGPRPSSGIAGPRRSVRSAERGYCGSGWCGTRRKVIRNAGGEQAWTAEAVALLGTMPDAELAEQLGRTSEAVRRKRARRGIPRFG